MRARYRRQSSSTFIELLTRRLDVPQADFRAEPTTVPLGRLAAAGETEWCGNANSARGRAAQLSELSSTATGASLCRSLLRTQAHRQNTRSTTSRQRQSLRAQSRTKQAAAAFKLRFGQTRSISEPVVLPGTTSFLPNDALTCFGEEAVSGCPAATMAAPSNQTSTVTQ